MKTALKRSWVVLAPMEIAALSNTLPGSFPAKPANPMNPCKHELRLLPEDAEGIEVGDLLMISERFKVIELLEDVGVVRVCYLADGLTRAFYFADGDRLPEPGLVCWTIDFPGFASTERLRVVGIARQPVEEMTERDCIAEGSPRGNRTLAGGIPDRSHKAGFAALWDDKWPGRQFDLMSGELVVLRVKREVGV